jgi:hypothetical protein
MGYLNPLLQLPAAQELMSLPGQLRALVECLFREIRAHANAEAETAWKRRKAPMAVYWRWVATISRHIAHALSKGGGISTKAYELVDWRNPDTDPPDDRLTVLIIPGGQVEAEFGYMDGAQWRYADGTPCLRVIWWAHNLTGPQS